MTFIKHHSGEWLELDKERMRAYNINGRYRDINESSLSNCQIQDFDSWHDLYQKTGYNPLIDNRLWRAGWISPYGDFYPCEAHEVDAETICILIYGEEHCYYSDRLVELGWLKVTDSLMFDIYWNNGNYNKMYSKEQEQTFNRWLETYQEGMKKNGL